MKVIEALVCATVLYAILGGCSEKTTVESKVMIDITSRDYEKSTEHVIAISNSKRASDFSIKEYIQECELLTMNQSLCYELGQDLLHTLKEFVDDLEDNL